ncbi:7-cyano-7-deazaguanine synthase QueC [Candidatus Neomarinimicrobiota bacterium]
MEKAIILLSGGLDSTTVLAIANKRKYELYALTVKYGQRHIFEIDAAKTIANHYSVKKHIISETNLERFGGSALTGTIEVPKDLNPMDGHKKIPVTYVPARNTIFLSLALAWAETIPVYDIFIGVNSVDYSGYPDCRLEFISAFENLANYATRLGTEDQKQITIHTPLISMSKSEIIKTGLSLGVDYGLTHSCYVPNFQGQACGHCDACLLRLKGFQDAGLIDPLQYQE